jgi:hypothetical protein
MRIQGPFLKKLAILPLIALLMASGCSSNTTTAQTAASGGWGAQLLGGAGEASGFSFTTQFTVNGDGSLSISYFQFLTEGPCFPYSGENPSGTMVLTLNSNDTVTGTFNFTVASSGNTLTLNNANVTGTEVGTTLSGGSVSGDWSLTGGTGCNATSGTFTMTQSASTT